MKPTGVPRPVRLGEPYKSVVRGKSVPSCDATVTCVLPVLYVLAILAQYSMNPSDAVRAHADAVWALEHPTASLVEQYGANTGPVEPTSMGACQIWHARLCTGPKSSEAHLWKLYMLIIQPRAIRPRMGPKTHKKSYKPAARSYTQSNQRFCYALNWQTRTQSFGV